MSETFAFDTTGKDAYTVSMDFSFKMDTVRANPDGTYTHRDGRQFKNLEAVIVDACEDTVRHMQEIMSKETK